MPFTSMDINAVCRGNTHWTLEIDELRRKWNKTKEEIDSLKQNVIIIKEKRYENTSKNIDSSSHVYRGY